MLSPKGRVSKGRGDPGWGWGWGPRGKKADTGSPSTIQREPVAASLAPGLEWCLTSEPHSRLHPISGLVGHRRAGRPHTHTQTLVTPTSPCLLAARSARGLP